MLFPLFDPDPAYDDPPRIPGWAKPGGAQDMEDSAFSAGAACAFLHAALAQAGLPRALLGDRLALRAAEAAMIRKGRPERTGDLRDALHLRRACDLPGPAGETYLCWRRAMDRPVSVGALHRALPGYDPVTLAGWLDAGRGAPVARAAFVLETVLEQAPGDENAALILADSALSQAMGWGQAVPLLSVGLKRGDLRNRTGALPLACHRALGTAAAEAVALATDLARRAALLRAVVPGLRARGAVAAVEMILTRDAVTPMALPLPDRAARRFCARLVDLGVLRELTGRDTFRLYGL